MNMDEQHEEDIQFKMPSDIDEDSNDPIEDHVIQKEVNELKLEKISHRVTLISILIPVLIVVVLVFTYLDIKRRVVQTEDTGAIEFKKLSNDLETRFGTLSVKQSRIEDSMARLTEQTNQILASIQVRLEKLDDSIKQTSKTSVDQKVFDSTKADLVKQLNAAIEATNEAGEQMAAISQTLKKQIDEVRQMVSDAQLQISELESGISDLESGITELKETKIDKASMDLTMRLEAMKVENALKMQMEDIRTIMKGIENRVMELESKQGSDKKPSAHSALPPDPQPRSIPPKVAKPSITDIQEQTINR